ncbi:MAG TPA: cell division protein ZipA [Candidatus Acidoferrum sp.]|nr:cell division protein ZipA [Candidatus Acidoferrum sp.]
MQLLDWLVVATVGAIVLVLLDGFRRKWRDRRNRVVMKLDRNIPQDGGDFDDFPNSELPNGGARTLVRDNEPPAVSPLRKRNYNLKDGRDKVRGNEPESVNVPVLMDPVEIDESEIEHANVFVTAEVTATSVEHFADDELPPDVADGLDREFHADAASTGQLLEDAADDYVSTSGDPLMDGMRDRAEDELDQQPEPQPEATTVAEPTGDSFDDEGLDHEHGLDEEEHPETVAALDEEQATDEHAADAETMTAETAEAEDEEEYDPYQDEHFYENEPALLENAYKLATSRFQRQPRPEQAPRIEPGFGDPAGEPEPEPDETFGAVIDESVMAEFLEEEHEEIRAWRNQSVTQQSVPQPAATAVREPPAYESEAQPIAVPEFEVSAVRVVARAAPEPEPLPQHSPEPIAVPAMTEAAKPAVTTMTTTAAALASTVATATTAATAVTATKEAKPGFWQSMTGKTAKPAKVEPPTIDQGELFGADETSPEPASPSGPQEVIIINVMAKPGLCFYGDELLPVLQHYGLRLGNMNIFHRHTEIDGSGPIMFSMANMVKPGTFSLGGMEQFVTPGISFFVQLPNRHGNMKAFEQMLATANAVKESLDGTLKDERRSVLTRQTVEHCRQRIRDFELSLLSPLTHK